MFEWGNAIGIYFRNYCVREASSTDVVKNR